MKILKYRIDKVTSHYPNGGEVTLYYVKYLKYGWFFNRWKYLMQGTRDGSEQRRPYNSVYDAVQAIKSHKIYQGQAQVTTEELEENGESMFHGW